MSTAEIIVRLSTLVGYGAVAAAACVSPTTTRAVVQSGELPSREPARSNLEAFAIKNATVTQRSEIRFI